LKFNRILLIVILISQIIVSIFVFQIKRRQPAVLSKEERILQIIEIQEVQKMLALADMILDKFLMPENIEEVIECSE
jgi:hypothetical protein